MERITRVRIGIILLVFCLILGFFSFKLYDMQIIETGGKVDNTRIFVTETRVKAARGNILDRNGNVLVTNRASYDLVMNHYIICSAPDTNDRLLELVNMCRDMNIDYIDLYDSDKAPEPTVGGEGRAPARPSTGETPVVPVAPAAAGETPVAPVVQKATGETPVVPVRRQDGGFPR